MPPTNTDCTHAISLNTVHDPRHGTFVGDFRDWSGTWDSADPIFTYFSEFGAQGGGTPLWWKWTNDTSDPVIFQVTLYQGGNDPGPVNVHGVKGALMIGACGSLVVNEDVPTSPTFYDQTSSYTYLHDPSGFAPIMQMIVHPGETVFIEFDNGTDDTVNIPPVVDPATLGSFLIFWQLRTVSLYDSMSTSTLVPDITNGMQASEIALGHIPWNGDLIPYDVAICGSRVYTVFGFGSYQSDGTTVAIPKAFWVGSCNLDGSDYEIVKLDNLYDIDYGFAGGDNTTRIPRIAYDGTNVYVITPGVRTVTNPDRTCTGSALYDTAVVYDWNLYVGSLVSFPLVATLSTEPAVHMAGFQAMRICASSAQPGVCFIGLAYQSRKTVTHTVSGIFGPTCENDPTQDWYRDHFERYEVTAGGSVTTLYQDYTQILVTDFDAHVSFPATSPWNVWDIINDEGYPILVRAIFTDVNPITYNPGFVSERFDTKASIDSFIYDDFIGDNISKNGATPPASSPGAKLLRPSGSLIDLSNPDVIRLHQRYFNQDRNRYERPISLVWDTVSASTPWATKMVANVPSDVTNNPNGVEPIVNTHWGYSEMTGSGAGTSGSTFFPEYPVWIDGERNAWVGSNAQYDRLCNHRWISGSGPSLYLGGGWKADGSNLHFYNGGSVFGQQGQLYDNSVIRDSRICFIGPPFIGRASIFWFFKDGTWHNAGNDPVYNLWYYKDGQWRSHLFDSQYWLYGQLDTTWQN